MEKDNSKALKPITFQGDVDFINLDDVAQPGSIPENKDYVTPYAFGIPNDLIGTPLASPNKRLFALLIDLAVIALLTQLSDFVLAGAFAFVLIKASNQLKAKGKYGISRKIMRGIGIISAFVFVIGCLKYMSGDEKTNIFDFTADKRQVEQDYTVAGGLAISAMKLEAEDKAKDIETRVEEGVCAEQECWQQHLERAATNITKLEPSIDLAELLSTTYSPYLNNISEEEFVSLVNESVKNAREQHPIMEQAVVEASDEVTRSFNALIKDLFEEFAFEFGWPLIYFSAMTGWFHGQSLGKRALKIKVIKLNGQPPNLWEGFGRYGGYGAGLATGLMGFLQIYWDPNRQCIQDKISETLVIDLNKPKKNLLDADADFD